MSLKPQPQIPSVTETAQAQTGTNVATAIANQQLNAVNQVGPNGSLTYSQNGTYSFTDPSTGKTYQLPKLTATTALSPEQQQLYETGQGINQNLASLGLEQSGRLSGLLSEPFSLDNEATEARLMELAGKRLDPMLERRRAAAETSLVNKGIRPGSDAWDRGIERVDQAETDAYNQLMLTGRGQAVQERLLERQTPLNEIIGLATGTQIGMPQYGGMPQAGIPTTDVAGLTNANYQQNYQQWLAGQQTGNNILGGLFGLGAAGIIASDERLKEDIHKVGETDDEIPIVSYRYKGDPVPRLGFLAQDVREKRPEAVVKIGGILGIDMNKMREAA